MIARMDAMTRRSFIKASTLAVAASSMPSLFAKGVNSPYPISAHLWIYASRFPPTWNSNPILDEIFADLSAAGMEGLELMEMNLRDDGIVERLKNLISKNNVPVTGTSYGADMWNKEKHSSIIEDVRKVAENLRLVGGTTFGISVNSPGRMKTDKELDDQATILKIIRKVCIDNGITPNLHNHTYEVENNLRDLKGTLERIPDFPLGPDVGWLAKAGIDPVEFVKTFGKKMVYAHLRDIDAKGEWTEAVGEGVIDFKGIMQAMHDAGFSGRVAIELAFPNAFTPKRKLAEDWKISADFIRKLQ